MCTVSVYLCICLYLHALIVVFIAYMLSFLHTVLFIYSALQLQICLINSVQFSSSSSSSSFICHNSRQVVVLLIKRRVYLCYRKLQVEDGEDRYCVRTVLDYTSCLSQPQLHKYEKIWLYVSRVTKTMTETQLLQPKPPPPYAPPMFAHCWHSAPTSKIIAQPR